jgi:acyl-CoA synthetase (AMP-forming)/AMP-acid ligase II
MPALDPTKLLDNAVDLARALGQVLRNPEEVLARAKLLRRKLPAIRRGLKLVGKSDKDEALSIGSFLEENARERPNGVALLYEGRRYTHREFNEQANRCADAFAARGIQKGDAVAIFVENRPELLFAVAGAVKLGAVAALINTRQRRHVLVHSFKLCQAKLYVVGEELWDAFAEVRGDLESAGPERVFWVADEGGARPADTIDAAAAFAAASPATPAALASVRLGDPCFYIYTSGTTGLPKAAIMSHFRWVKAAGAFGLLALDLSPSDVVYVCLPLYHNNALTVTWSSVAATGAAMAIRRKFSVSQFWDDVRRFRATAFCYIGELCRYLNNQPPQPDDADNPVTKIIGNGLRPDIWKGFKQRFGIDEVYEFYAASEGNIAFVNVLNLDSTCGVCPAPYAIVEYDVAADAPVRSPDGRMRRVGRGGVGLLIGEVSPRYAFDGYTDKAASEKKLLRDVFKPGDCWFNSGDLMRDQGFRHAQFVDRVGDTFRWKGENVSTNEVAEVLNTWDGVAESTVYGVHLPNSDGRAGMAAVVSARPPEALDLGGLVRHLREQLPPYAIPLFLRFRTELEVTSTFKQRKVSLRDEGFDPARVGEPLFVLLPGAQAYTALTPELHAKIASGAIAF